MDETFSYAAICSFFEEKILLSLCIASLDSENMKQEACALPTPPEMALSFGTEGEEENAIRYWEENLVDEALCQPDCPVLCGSEL